MAKKSLPSPQESLTPLESFPVSHWNPKNVVWYRRRITKVLVGSAVVFPILAWLVSTFLQLRGYVNLIASRVLLVPICIFGIIGWCFYAINRQRRQLTFAIVGSIVVVALTFGLDRITIPSKSALILKTSAPAPTLESLFKSDFPNTNRFTINAEPTVFEDGESVVVTSQEYADFPARSSFIGYYIPSTPLTFRVCVRVANSPRELLNTLAKKISMQTNDASATKLTDLSFSGRVFIYHEWPLTLRQKSRLVDYYESKHLAVEFRGPEYLRDQTLVNKLPK